MIVVTGATGRLGSAVVERLLARLPGEQLAVSVRDPERASALAGRGVRVRRGDFDDPAGLPEAFAGATRMLLVSAATVDHRAAVRQHRAAVEAARAAGVERIVYTSHMGANPASPFPPMRTHAATESVLAESGVAFTALRNGFYASTTVLLLAHALAAGRLAVPADGPVSWTDHDDLADAAVLVLTEGGFEGPTPALTAPAALDLAEVVEIASELVGRPITRTVVPDREFRDALLARGTPEPVVDLQLGMFLASRENGFAAVDPALEKLLGRPVRSVRDVLAETLPR